VSGASDAEGQERYHSEIAACGEWRGEGARAMGFRWLAKPGRWYCVEWPAESSPSPSSSGAARPALLGVPVHIDVVPVGDGWTHPPFSGKVVDGFVWGRGALDDKGPLIATLYGLHALRRAGFRPPVTYRLIIGTKEEIGEWEDIHEYLAEEGAPDFGFTPDADFPLITGEKGILNFTIKTEWPVPDPAMEALETPPAPLQAAASVLPVEFVSLRGGIRANIVPDTCELVLRYPAAERNAVAGALMARATQFTVDHPGAKITILPESARSVEGSGGASEELLITFLGKPAHGSAPQKGHNAIVDALAFTALLDELPAPIRKFAGFVAFTCADYTGGQFGIASTHEFIGPTTINLGIGRLDAKGGEVVINVRPTLGLDTREVVKRAADTALDYSRESGLDIVVVAPSLGKNALFLDPAKAGPFLKGLQEGFKMATGREAELRSIGGTTYAKAIPNCCAFGPIWLEAGEEDLTHQRDERVGVEVQVRNVNIYGLALACAGLNLAK